MTWSAGPAANIVVTPATPSQTVGTDQTETATVTDQFGNNVTDGTTVKWVVEGTNAGTATPATGSGTTTNGQATFTYHNTKIGTDTVRAYIDADNSGTYNTGEINGTASVTWTPGAASSIAVDPLTPSQTVGNNQKETATVTDQYGNTVANGTTVKWVVEGANVATASNDAASSTTTNGQAIFNYSNTKTGTDTVRAYIDADNSGTYNTGEINGTATVTWTPDVPATLVLDPSAPTQDVNTNLTETATVTDQFGNSVADGTTISWVVQGTNSSTASPSSDTSTTASGKASFTYTNSVPGTDTVVAFYDVGPSGLDVSDPQGNATVTWTYPKPVAVNDTFSATGNVQITVPDANGVLGNDTLNNGTLSTFDATSANGGTVSVDASGGFTYNPPAGFTGADSFNYSLSNLGGTSTATVTINVSHVIWFINNAAASAGDGRLTSPFDSLSAFTTAGGGSTSDVVFVYTGTNSYTGGLTLKNAQLLIGQGVDLTSNLGFTPATYSNTLPSTGVKPTIVNSGGVGVTLGSSNTVKGLTIGTTSGYGISGTSFGTLTVSNVNINGSGPMLYLKTGTLATTFDSLSSSSSTGYGVYIDSVSGTFTVSGATSISSAAAGIAISNSGSLTTSLTGLTIANSGGTGLSMSTGGTVTVTGTTNSITSSGTAISLTSTTIGSGGVAFKSVSSSTATNGIVLNGTGSGAFTVTGDGSTAGSGGTIQSIVNSGVSLTNANNVSLSYMKFINADTTNGTGTCDQTSNVGCNASINMSTVSDVSLDHLSVSGGVQQGINGNNVTELTLSNSTISNVGNSNFDHGIYIMGLFGTQSANTASSISNTTVTGSHDSNVFIRNSSATNASASTPDSTLCE